MADATSTVAIEESAQHHLMSLERKFTELKKKHSELRIRLVEAVTAALAALKCQVNTAGSLSAQIPLPSSPEASLQELSSLLTAKQYLLYLQELQALTRHAEKISRSCERALANGDPDLYPKEFSDTVDAFNHAMSYAIALDQAQVQSPVLLQHGSGAIARVTAVGTHLKAMLTSAIQQTLDQLGWPPRLLGSTTSAEGDHLQSTTVSTSGVEFNGFLLDNSGPDGRHPALLLHRLFIIQLTLQRATEFKAFAALTQPSSSQPQTDIMDGPLLWPSIELVTSIEKWLSHHFAHGLPTDRIDKPEWLFAAGIKAAKQCSPYADDLQSCISAHQLDPWYSMQLDVARCIGAVAVGNILRSHVLPRLQSTQNGPAWLHFIDESIVFEKNLAPLRGMARTVDVDGSAAPAVVNDGETITAVHPMSVVEIVFEQEDWAQGWLNAEFEDAERQVDAAVDALDGWKPALNVDDLALVTADISSLSILRDTDRRDVNVTPSRSTLASQHEFCPPQYAVATLSLIVTLVQRQSCIYSEKSKALFTSTVIQPTLKAFRARLAAMLLRAEQFDHLLDDTGLPKVGAAICGAHFMEHNLREPPGTLLVAIAEDESLAAALEKEASALTTFRRQWSYKLAKLAVNTFQSSFAPYKKHLDGFKVSHIGDVLVPQGPTPSLLPAADGLNALLSSFSSCLDAVLFRDVWRAIALAVNFAMFNEIATEGVFSEQGAVQLQYDVDALIGVFASCTARPAAHFKESKEACLLLCSKYDQVSHLMASVQIRVDRASGESMAAEGVQQSLAAAGVKALNAEQVLMILSRRSDMQTI